MSREIPESDWRQFKEVHKLLVERFCQRVLEEIVRTTESGQGTAHDKYLRIYKLIQKRDKELGRAFNDFRRSTAVMQLIVMRQMGLLTEQDLSRFTHETQRTIEEIASLDRF